MQVQWKYKCSSAEYESYEPNINAKIEAAYSKKQDSVEWEEQTGTYRIEFDKMLEIQVGNDETTNVQRTFQGTGSIHKQ